MKMNAQCKSSTYLENSGDIFMTEKFRHRGVGILMIEAVLKEIPLTV